jgi:Protein of unknown function (DUF3103)
MRRSRFLLACAVVGVFGCVGGEPIRDPIADPVADPVGQAWADQMLKRATAAHLAGVLIDAPLRDQLISELRLRGPLALSEITGLVGEVGVEPLDGAVPEVSLREPANGAGAANLVVAWAPAGDERHWTEIPAYQLGGARVALDPLRTPDVPVLVVETHGRLAMLQEIESANTRLQRAGLQRAPSKIGPIEVGNAAGDLQTTLLTSVRLADDREPWISGAAETYAIVSGVIGSNDPQLIVVDMPYLDNDKTTYAPNQILINWGNFQYQVANIQLFEHDSNTNYQDLVTAIIAAVGAVGSLAGFPVVQAVSEIANRIVAAIPANAFTNDDDYVDSFYTIEETRTYTGRVGASNNATISIQPFTVVAR